MNQAIEADVGNLTVLTPVVSRAVGRETVEVLNWHLHSIHAPFNQATGGLYRIAGTGRDRGELVSWSLILKVIRASNEFLGGTIDPFHWNYWKRELLIYQSDHLQELAGLRRPLCYGAAEHGDIKAWIWLEDVGDQPESPWPLERYQLAARHLGQFNGAFLAGRPIPPIEGLSRQWLRSFVSGWAPSVGQLRDARERSIIRRCYPGGLLDRILRLWDDQEALLAALDRLPQTFCHLDAFPHNLLFRRRPDGSEETIGIDWAFAGVAPVGAELAPLVAASVIFFDAEPAQLSLIEELAFDGYLQGLHDAGWDDDTAGVRFGYAATAALHYALFPLGVLLLDDQTRAHLERLWGHPIDDVIDRWVALTRFLCDRADEARRLLLQGKEWSRGLGMVR